jgi:ribonuclease P/MRP protein subunit RPP1
MRFYDLHVHSIFSEGISSLEQLAETAKFLGYKAICFSAYYKNSEQIKKIYEEIEKVKDKVGIEIFLGFEARNIKELSLLARRRKKFDLLLVRGGDLRMNRAACETPEVDILTHPEFGRTDSGMNQVLMKLAAKNQVAIELNFHEVLLASRSTRAKILSNMKKNVFLAEKYRVDIVTCSAALSHFELKDPLVLASFANQLGLSLADAKRTVTKTPQEILQRAKQRRREEWIMPGVEIVKEAR